MENDHFGELLPELIRHVFSRWQSFRNKWNQRHTLNGQLRTIYAFQNRLIWWIRQNGIALVIEGHSFRFWRTAPVRFLLLQCSHSLFFFFRNFARWLRSVGVPFGLRRPGSYWKRCGIRVWRHRFRIKTLLRVIRTLTACIIQFFSVR